MSELTTKKQFDKMLKASMKNAPQGELEKLLEFYDELFNEKTEQGLREEVIIKGFGSPERIVEELDESLFNHVVKKTREKARKPFSIFRWFGRLFTNKSFLIFYFSAFVITFPLTAALFGVVVGLVSALFAVVVAILATVLSIVITILAIGISFILAGPVGVGFGVINLINGHTDTGMAQIGIGLVLFGVGVIFLFLLRILRYLRIALFVKKTNKATRYKSLGRGKTFRIIIAVTSLICILVGGAIFTYFFYQAGWNTDFLNNNFNWPFLK